MKVKQQLKDNERWDDLELDGLGVIQSEKEYAFTSDAVLLANYIKAGHKDDVIELCSGSGVISVIMGYKKKPKSITLVEIQEAQADRSNRTMIANQMQATVICDKFQGIHEKVGAYAFDVCYANPPYRPSTLASSSKKQVALSTHEIEMTLHELVVEAEKLLRFGGKFFIVYTASRLSELIFELKSCKLEPKNLTMVHPKVNKPAELVLVTAVKGGKSGIVIDPIIIEKDENNHDTDIMRAIYNSKK